MENTLSNIEKPPLSNSSFFMLRCLIAVAQVDNDIDAAELGYLRKLITHLSRTHDFTQDQKNLISIDMSSPQPIRDLLKHVTDQADKDRLILFASLMAEADGQMHAAENEILSVIREACAPPPLKPHDVAITAAPVPQTTQQPLQGEIIDAGQTPVISEASGVARQMQSGNLGLGSGMYGVIDSFVEQTDVLPTEEKYAFYAEETPHVSRSIRGMLAGDERVIRIGHFHWMYTLKAVLWWAGLTFVGYKLQAPFLKLLQWMYIKGLNPGNMMTWAEPQLPMHIGFFLGALWFMHAMAVKYTTNIVLTDKRLIFRSGIIFVNAAELSLIQASYSTIHQTRIGAIFNYGKVEAFTFISGDKNVLLPDIEKPYQFSSTLDRLKRMGGWAKAGYGTARAANAQG